MEGVICTHTPCYTMVTKGQYYWFLDDAREKIWEIGMMSQCTDGEYWVLFFVYRDTSHQPTQYTTRWKGTPTEFKDLFIPVSGAFEEV